MSSNNFTRILDKIDLAAFSGKRSILLVLATIAIDISYY